MVVPQNGWFQWFIVENPMRNDHLGAHSFWETSIWESDGK